METSSQAHRWSQCFLAHSLILHTTPVDISHCCHRNITPTWYREVLLIKNILVLFNYSVWTAYILKNEIPTWSHLLFYFTYYVLNMFRTLIYPSSGACDCVDELPYRPSCSQFVVCWRFGAAGFRWCSFCRLKPAKSRTKSSNTQRTENKTTDVVIHQNSRKFLMMDILMSETCWAHKKWNKIAKWHQVGLSFFNYYNDARSNKH